MTEAPTIAAMPLYTNLDRVARGLAAKGIGPNDPIPPESLFALDQWHYHGTEAIQAAGERLGLGPTSRVLDIGAGIGGPARYLAYTFGCHVTALELQADLHAIGVDLTKRSGLADRVTQVCGDALTTPIPDRAFDAAVSWLAVLHIPDRPALAARMARALKPGGACFIEDLCMRAPFSPDDLKDLRAVVFGITVTSIEDYAADFHLRRLRRCGDRRSDRRLGALCRRAAGELAEEPRRLCAHARRRRLRRAGEILHDHRASLSKR